MTLISTSALAELAEPPTPLENDLHLGTDTAGAAFATFQFVGVRKVIAAPFCLGLELGESGLLNPIGEMLRYEGAVLAGAQVTLPLDAFEFYGFADLGYRFSWMRYDTAYNTSPAYAYFRGHSVVGQVGLAATYRASTRFSLGLQIAASADYFPGACSDLSCGLSYVSLSSGYGGNGALFHDFAGGSILPTLRLALRFGF